MKMHFVVDEDTMRIIGAFMCDTSEAPDIRRVIADVKKDKPVGWSMDDIVKALPSDCKYIDSHENSLIYV